MGTDRGKKISSPDTLPRSLRHASCRVHSTEFGKNLPGVDIGAYHRSVCVLNFPALVRTLLLISHTRTPLSHNISPFPQDIGWADFSYNNGTAATPRVKEWTEMAGTIVLVSVVCQRQNGGQ